LPITARHPARFRAAAVVNKRRAFDRAAVMATAIMQIITTARSKEALQRIEDYLRDELADVERQVAAHRESGDA
jgi:hypothetical protein